jgi:predicted secreted protein
MTFVRHLSRHKLFLLVPATKRTQAETRNEADVRFVIGASFLLRQTAKNEFVRTGCASAVPQ